MMSHNIFYSEFGLVKVSLSFGRMSYLSKYLLVVLLESIQVILGLHKPHQSVGDPQGKVLKDKVTCLYLTRKFSLRQLVLCNMLLLSIVDQPLLVQGLNSDFVLQRHSLKKLCHCGLWLLVRFLSLLVHVLLLAKILILFWLIRLGLLLLLMVVLLWMSRVMVICVCLDWMSKLYLKRILILVMRVDF